MNYLEHVGKYCMMLRQVFKTPQRPLCFIYSLFTDIEDVGHTSLGIIMFLSFFIWWFISLHTALTL